MREGIVAILPGYNVARHLQELVERLRAVVPEVALCLVDDGSSDGTADAARSLGIVVLEHPQNRGKGAALCTGFEHALSHDFEAVLTLDADGQHRPEEIPRFVGAWKQGFDVVVGNRMDANENMPWLRKRTNEVTSLVVSWLAGTQVPDSQSGFRLFDARVLAALRIESQRYDMESEILIKAGRLGYSIGAVPITTVYRDEDSSIHPVVDTGRFLRMVWRARRWIRRPGIEATASSSS